MVQQAIDRWGRIDIVVNVAGILRDRMIFNMTEEEWDAVIAVHLKGTYNTMRAASVSMRQQQYGRFINMSSVSALGAPGQPNYAAAKAGIIGLTWSTANAMAKYNVTANTIMPSGATRMIDSTPAGPRGVRADGQVAERAGGGHRARSRQRGTAGRLSRQRGGGPRQRPGLPLLRVRLHLARPAPGRPPHRRRPPARSRASWRSCFPRRSEPTSSRRPPWASAGPCTSGRPASGRISAAVSASGSGRARSGERGRARHDERRPVSTVLFVCHANTCRSVMAHVLLERMLRERGGGRRGAGALGWGGQRGARRHAPVARRPHRPP